MKKSILSWSLFRAWLLAVAVLGASVVPASAQIASGRFTLTHDARWGKARLTPGDYWFSLQSTNWPAPLMVGRVGGDKVAIVLPESVSVLKPAATSQMTLNHMESGESFVSALYLPNVGLALRYAGPKQRELESAKLGPVAESRPGK